MNVKQMEMKKLTVSDKEWRFNRVREFLQTKGLKAMLVCGEARREANIRYFTGQYHRIGLGINYVLFPVSGDPILFTATPERQFNLVTYLSFIDDHWVKDARVLSMDNMVKAFEEKELTLSSIGLTLDLIPAVDYLQLRQKLPHTEFIDISSDYKSVRAVKSEGEISLAQESARIVDISWDRVAREMKPGMYEHEVIALMEDTMWQLDVDKTFNQSLCSRKDVSRPTWPSTHSPKLIKDGDLFLAEITASYGGYYTQKVSLFSLGKPDTVAQELFDVCKIAHQKATQLISPGVNTKDIIVSIDRTIQDAGFLSSTQFPTGPHGHLMGLDVDEGTFLPGEDFILETGMVLAIHPGAAISNWVVGESALFGPGSVYLVTKNGAKSLNQSPNGLVVID
ncbi:MAG: hypothetical protein APF84_03215 [Gracilibacter sp. BRH_c7a]|nr:MAG: hypothetical protein APF84_03215 [Gracilibacter sp. BRH_c7a]